MTSFVSVTGATGPSEPILSLTGSERTCPGAPIKTEAACNAIPNAVWIPSTSAVILSDGTTATGRCHCCSVDGSTYVVSPTAGGTDITACRTCPSNSSCGDQNGFCKQPNNPNCVQNSSTFKWSLTCPSNVSCGNGCNGSCGVGEWFAFQSCSKTNNDFSCTFNIGQWKSWLTYAIIIAIIILIIYLIFYSSRGREETVTVAGQAPTTAVVTPSPELAAATQAYTGRRAYYSMPPPRVVVSRTSSV